MALYDDKRFILSHIRHSFITCDDTGMSETVMLNEHYNRYPIESLYHHPFDYDSDEDLEAFGAGDDGGDEEEAHEEEVDGHGSLSNGRITQNDIDFFKVTEVDYKSELVEDNPMNSFDIMSDSYEMGMRRRSNTAQRLDKMKKERKHHSKTKIVTWKSPTKIVKVMGEGGEAPKEKRVVLNPAGLPKEELELLEYDEKENVYYETVAYRKLLFPFIPDDPVTPTNEEEEAQDQAEEATDQTPELPSIPNSISKPKSERRKSVLTLQIERSPTAPVNPFNEFTRFDGLVSEGNVHTKRIRIFFRIFEQDIEFQKTDFTKKLAMMSTGVTYGPNWIEIVVLASAKVCELIGLICWNYTHLQIGPPLKPDPGAYALKIAEENGDVDNDFPALTAGDDIKRYGFPYLALVELEMVIVVTVNFELDQVFSQITINSLSTTLREIIDQIKKKRPHLFRHIPAGDLGSMIRLELQPSTDKTTKAPAPPPSALDLDSRISEYIEQPTSTKAGQHAEVNLKLKFNDHLGGGQRMAGNYLDATDNTDDNIGTGSFKDTDAAAVGASGAAAATTSATGGTLNRTKQLRTERDWSQNMLDMMEAPLYQCFEVNAVHKLYNTPVELGISGTKLEITPRAVFGKSPNWGDRLRARFNQMKAVNIDVEDVVDCEIVHRNKMELLGRLAFKLVYYTGSDFKSLKFEGDGVTIDDILFKLGNVMKMRTSPRRNEYQAIKSRKKSISTKIYLKSRMMLSSSSSSSDDDTTDDSTGPMSGGGGDSVLSDPSGPDGSYFGTLGSRQKKESKFRRFKSRP